MPAAGVLVEEVVFAVEIHQPVGVRTVPGILAVVVSGLVEAVHVAGDVVRADVLEVGAAPADPQPEAGACRLPGRPGDGPDAVDQRRGLSAADGEPDAVELAGGKAVRRYGAARKDGPGGAVLQQHRSCSGGQAVGCSAQSAGVRFPAARAGDRL